MPEFNDNIFKESVFKKLQLEILECRCNHCNGSGKKPDPRFTCYPSLSKQCGACNGNGFKNGKIVKLFTGNEL